MSATQSNLTYRSEALTSSKEQGLNYIPPAAAAVIGELYFFDWMQPLFFGTVAIGLILAVIILAAHFKWPESNHHRYVWALFCVGLTYAGIDAHNLFIFAPLIGVVMVLYLPARPAFVFMGLVTAITFYELSYHQMDDGERVVIAAIVFATFTMLSIFNFKLRSAFEAWRLDRKMIQKSLTEKEQAANILQRNFDALQNSNLGFYWVDEQGRITFSNEAIGVMLGYTKAEMLQLNVVDIDPEVKENELALERRRHKLKETGVLNFSGRLNHKNGEILEVDNSAYQHIDYRGCPSTAVVVRNLTEEKKLSSKLAEQSAEQQAILSNAQIGIYRSVDRKVEWANERAAEIFGYPLDEFIGMDTRLWHVSQEVFDRVGKLILDMVKNDKTVRFEEPLKKKNGETIWVRLTGKAMSERLDNIDIIFSIEDISEERAAKQCEAQALQAAQAANKAKSDLLANVSHEVRTPINLIQGMTEVLKDRPLDEETLKQIRLIEQGTETLLSQVNQLLDLTRIENQKLELTPEDFDLSQMVRDVVAMSEARAAGKGLKMHLEQVSDELCVHGDETRLRQILLNLIGNALKYSEKGSVTVSLNALMKGQSQYQVQLAVKDNGKGIDQALAQRLFQRFSKGDHDQSVPSTGLGLSISKELVELMGGDIRVDSTPGQGSTFTVNLVLDKASDRPAVVFEKKVEPEVSLMPKPLRQINSLGELSVLAVDDVETNLMVVDVLLAKMGIQAQKALSAEAAFELLQKEAVDVVLMDIQMPGMNGIEATQKIRQGDVAGVNPELPIIALTANVMQGDVEHYLANGMNDYLSKPVSVKDLTRVLEPLVTGDLSGQLK